MAINTNKEFNFDGGRVCLDFCNTVDERPGIGRARTIRGEFLESGKDLLEWSLAAKIISNQIYRERLDTGVSARNLSAAISVRELLFRIFSSIVENHEIADNSLKELNGHIQNLPPQRIIRTDNGYNLSVGKIDSIEGILEFILRDAIQLITSDRLPRLKICGAEECGWLFLDLSKNGSRRWCDMADCGNRVKARKFYKNSLKR